MDRDDLIKMTHHDFQMLMRDYSEMAKETKNKRLLARCAKLCLEQVVTGVTRGEELKKLCYRTDDEYIKIAKGCLK